MHAAFRSRLFDAMGDGVAILAAPGELLRNHDTGYRYRPESAFWLATGCDEPDALAVLLKKGRERRFVMYVRPRDPQQEMWAGKRIGPEGARKQLGANEAHPLAEFPAALDELLKGRPRLYLALDGSPLQAQVLAALSRLVSRRRTPGVLPEEVRDLRRLVGEARLRKTSLELERMERAARITGEAFGEAFRLTRAGVAEYQLRAVFPCVYGLFGADWAFETIVAAGANACTLHYISCQDRLVDGQLVLFDAGAEVDCFAADVTRTIPVNGRFSKDQETLYRIVLDAHQAAVATAAPGVPVDDVHAAAARVVTEGLLKLGLLKGKLETNLAKLTYKRWFPHGTSHWLGLDVHDVGDYALDEGPRLLEEGMVLTVEPGLYLPADDKKVPERYRGIGIRIEDDVLVTAGGRRVLTEAIPREPREIEAAMATRTKYLKALPAVK